LTNGFASDRVLYDFRSAEGSFIASDRHEKGCKMQDFQTEIAKFSKEIVNKCYSCGTCSSGCIFARHMDYTPTQIMNFFTPQKLDRGI
jgi:heterodisulfide reductase subunit C